MTKVKICGLTTSEQVKIAIDSGADFMGFVFAKSKRKVTPEQVALMTKNSSNNIKKVGVFVSPSLIELEDSIEKAQLDIIQLHGIQQPEVINALDQNYFKKQQIEVIEAFSGQEKNLVNQLKESHADYLLIDAPSDNEIYAGGNGKSFDWQLAAEKLNQVKNKKIIIAGGLTPENVEQARDLFNPYALDVSSGVETNGIKDSKKINNFIIKAKEKKYV